MIPLVGKIIDGTYFKTEQESGRLRMHGGSWTIPTKILSKIRHVKYRTESAVYTISVNDALVYGHEMPTKQGEQKLVVPVKHWNCEKFDK